MTTSKELVVASSPQPFRIVQAPESEFSLKDFWNVIVRRKSIVFGTIGVCVALATLLCVLSTPRYQSIGEIQVQKETADALGLETMIGAADGGSDALDASITMQTQAQVLQSDSLALKVIKELDLEHTEDFTSKFSPIGWVLGLFSPSGGSVVDPKGVSLDQAPVRRRRALMVFNGNLKVKQLVGTRLIDIKYLSPDAGLSAAVVNHLIQGLIDFNFQTRYNATEQAAGWLGDKLSDLRKQSQDLQAKVVSLQRESGVFSIGETDAQGREEVYTPALDKLQQATQALGQAQSSRILKGALYQVIKSGDPELISGLAGSTTSAGSPNMMGALTLIQNLRGQEATTRAQLNEMSAKFGDAYPKLSETQANLESVQRSIAAEVTRIAERAKNDYEISRQVEESARVVFDMEKKRAEALNDRAIELMIVKQEADQSRTLYEGLLTKVKQAGVLAGLRSSNISIVDPGRVPAKPARPIVALYLAISLGCGLIFGFFGALVRDAMDNKIEDIPALEAYLGEPPLGILAYHKARRRENNALNSPGLLVSTDAKLKSFEDCPAISQPSSPYSESVRALRTSLILSHRGSPPQVVLVTSSISGEGKTMLSLNLAVLMTQQNRANRVLLIDADLRHPTLHRRAGVNSHQGLSSILTNEMTEDSVLSAPVSLPSVPGLDILTGGNIPPYPSELLGSEQMQQAVRIWRDHYDFIIVDGAPLLPVTDSVLLAPVADLTLIVARYKMTERQSLRRSCRLLLAQEGSPRIGVVLNAVESGSSAYFQYYGYKQANYNGGAKRA